MTRSCGGCSACCKVLGIETPELTKPRGQWCPNCRPGQGCAIYESRPTVCRDFKCAWLAGESLGDEFRPDRLKVMFTLEPSPLKERKGKLCAVGRSLGGPDIYERPAVVNAIVDLIGGGFDVHLSFGPTKVRVVPHYNGSGNLRALDFPDPVGKTMRRREIDGGSASTPV